MGESVPRLGPWPPGVRDWERPTPGPPGPPCNLPGPGNPGCLAPLLVPSTGPLRSGGQFWALMRLRGQARPDLTLCMCVCVCAPKARERKWEPPLPMRSSESREGAGAWAKSRSVCHAWNALLCPLISSAHQLPEEGGRVLPMLQLRKNEAREANELPTGSPMGSRHHSALAHH